MALPPNIRINARVPFPAVTQGAGFITVTKSNGVWTIAPNYGILSPVASYTSTQIVAVYDTNSKTYGYVPLSALIGQTPKQINDVNYAASVVDTWMVYETLTATRTVTLQPLSSYLLGQEITIGDESGNTSPSVKIVISGPDTIGDGSPLAIVTPYSLIKIKAGATRWLLPQ